jgi:CspA family cold shock protein
MSQGIVKWFNRNMGFGFIELDETRADVFVHFSQIQGDGSYLLDEGDRVEFEIDEMTKGLRATQVRKVGLIAIAE